MTRLRLHLRRIGRLALAAMLGLALAPTWSHALASATGDRLARADLCTVLGADRVAPGGDARDGGAPSALGHVLAHCPYCSQGADAPGLPSAQRAAVMAFGAGAGPVPVARQVPMAGALWTAALPRAPPRLL